MLPPSYSKVDPSASSILLFALTTPTLPLSRLDEYAETSLAQRISTVEGVAQVQVYGSQKYAVRVQLDPQKLAALRIGIDEVARAIDAGNVNLPTGTLWGTDQAQSVQANGMLGTAADFRPLSWRTGTAPPVRLQDLGRVVDGVQDSKVASWFNGTRSVILAIQRQPGTNTVEVARRVKAAVAPLAADLPASVQLQTMLDRSLTIEASVTDVKFTLLLTLCLVVLVIFLFLRNLTATVIPSLALPMSLVGTFAVMYLLGYSLDNLSLMALTLAVGFVVDDAIVMLENIVRHREMGKGRMQAALRRGPGDRLHDRLDDAFAGGRLHPGALPGRPHRPVVPRVRGDDQRSDPGLRIRLPDPDPDALQPVPPAGGPHAPRTPLPGHRAGLGGRRGGVSPHPGLGHGSPPLGAGILCS